MQKAHTVKKFFSRETIVSVDIGATPEKVWQVITDLSNYKKWNTTIVSIEGEVKLGGHITLVPTLNPTRTFKLKIKTFEPNHKLVSGDMMGNRTYLLERNGDGTHFTMTEKIGGPLFPLFANMIPSFDESFDTFASDLKKETEKIG